MDTTRSLIYRRFADLCEEPPPLEHWPRLTIGENIRLLPADPAELVVRLCKKLPIDQLRAVGVLQGDEDKLTLHLRLRTADRYAA